jgi:ankyrin repeat protein
MSTLHSAVNSGNLERVRVLINRGEFIDTQTSDHCTALHRAVKSRREDIVRFLIDNGANCNIPNNDGHTPLHFAAMTDNILILLLLLEGHAELNAKDVYFFIKKFYTYFQSPFLAPDKTPLHYSSENGFVDMVKFLCSSGADVNAIDANGVALFLIGLLSTSLPQTVTLMSSKFC